MNRYTLLFVPLLFLLSCGKQTTTKEEQISYQMEDNTCEDQYTYTTKEHPDQTRTSVLPAYGDAEKQYYTIANGAVIWTWRYGGSLYKQAIYPAKPINKTNYTVLVYFDNLKRSCHGSPTTERYYRLETWRKNPDESKTLLNSQSWNGDVTDNSQKPYPYQFTIQKSVLDRYHFITKKIHHYMDKIQFNMAAKLEPDQPTVSKMISFVTECKVTTTEPQIVPTDLHKTKNSSTPGGESCDVP